MQNHMRVQLRIRRPAATPRAVVCRHDVAFSSEGVSRRTVSRSTRRRTIGTYSVACASAASTARSCAASNCARSSGDPSAHTTLTLFGALNVASIAATAEPPAPPARSRPPVAGF